MVESEIVGRDPALGRPGRLRREGLVLAQGVPRPSPVQRRALDRRKMCGDLHNFYVPEGGEEIALRRRKEELCTRGKEGIG